MKFGLDFWPSAALRWRLRHITVENSSRPTPPPLRCTPNKPICRFAARRLLLPVPQPILGVSSPDLGRSSSARPLLFLLPALPRAQAASRSVDLTYAATGLLHCNRDLLQFVRRTSTYTPRGRRRVAGFAALLGRFLPRLGPFGSPGGLFSLGSRPQARCAASAPGPEVDAHRLAAVAVEWRPILHCSMTSGRVGCGRLAGLFGRGAALKQERQDLEHSRRHV